MKQLRYGIVGCGAAGKVHGYHFSRSGNVECVAACDSVMDHATRFKEWFGFERTYRDYSEMLSAEGLDIVSVCTPPGLHAEQVITAARSGSQVLCEKPLATRVADAEAMVEACREQNVLLGVMLPRRYYNNSVAAKKVIDEGTLGKVTRVHFQLDCYKKRSFYNGWRGVKSLVGGGVLMSQAIHSIDQLVFFFGAPVSWEGKTFRTRDYIEVEDEAEGTVTFANGVVAEFRVTANSRESRWRGITEIEGERGAVVLDSEKVLLWDVPGADLPDDEEPEDVPPEFKPSYYGPGHLKVINNFIGAVTGKKHLIASGETSLNALRIILGIYASANCGKNQ